MEAAVESNEVLAAGGIAGQLHGSLYRLCAGVGVENALGRVTGCDLLQFARQSHHALVIEVGARHVDEVGGLLADGGHHLRVGVAGGDHGDAGGEVEEEIAVHVLHHGAAATADDQRVAAGVGGGNQARIAVNDAPGVGPRQGGLQHGKLGFQNGFGFAHRISPFLVAICSQGRAAINRKEKG